MAVLSSPSAEAEPPELETEGGGAEEVAVPWPSLDAYWRIGLASREGLNPEEAIARARQSAERVRAERIRDLNRRTAAPRQQLWKRQVREWLDQKHLATDWGPPLKDEVMLVGWFNAIDTAKSGYVTAAEVATFLRGSGVEISTADVEAKLIASGDNPHERFDLHVFLRLMSRAHGVQEEDGKEIDKRTADLHIMAMRRQRMLSDIRQPRRRQAFESYESFCREYGVNIRAPKLHGKEYHEKLKAAVGVAQRPMQRPTMVEILNPRDNCNAWEKATREWERAAREEARLKGKVVDPNHGNLASSETPSRVRSTFNSQRPSVDMEGEILRVAEELQRNTRRQGSQDTSGNRGMRSHMVSSDVLSNSMLSQSRSVGSGSRLRQSISAVSLPTQSIHTSPKGRLVGSASMAALSLPERQPPCASVAFSSSSTPSRGTRAATSSQLHAGPSRSATPPAGSPLAGGGLLPNKSAAILPSLSSSKRSSSASILASDVASAIDKDMKQSFSLPALR